MSGIEANLGDIWGALQAGGMLGALALASKFYIDRRKLQQQALKDGRQADLDLESHRDSLTFELLEAARSEVAALREERRRLSEQHIRHFEDALSHIEALLLAEGNEERATAERQARAFLNRMRRIADAKGTVINEIQRLASEKHIAEREADAAARKVRDG